MHYIDDDYLLLLNLLFCDNPSKFRQAQKTWSTVDQIRPHLPTFLPTPKMAEAQKTKQLNLARHFDGALYRQKLKALGIYYIKDTDSDFPDQLRQIHDPPALLFYKGNRTLLSADMLAIVGSRDITPYGQECTSYFARELAPHFLIISGMASGVDTIAHEAALDQGRPTIAVVGTGLDQIYPASNKTLCKRIIENGLLLSEYPPESLPIAFHFPMRNRIISGLSKGVLVIEAGEKSGALITAKQAADQGRDVFVVPGPIFSPVSQGCHILIQEGAKLVQNCDDILADYHPGVDTPQLPFLFTRRETPAQEVPPRTPQEKPPVSTDQADILSALKTPLTLDELSQKTSRPISTLLSALTILELNQHIQMKQNRYSRI